MPASPRRPPLRLLSRPDHARLLRGFRTLLPRPPGLERHLAGVIEDTLAHPGTLVRAQLAWAVLRENGVDADAALRASIAIEYFHTASLLFDDLPCMDDARERRGHACPHVTWGEAAATLGALGLINQGYGLLWQVLGTLPAERRERASALVTECLGLAGVLDGQSHDLHFADGPRTESGVLRVACGKTVPLIRLPLVLPAIVAGAPDEDVARLEALAVAWGLAYQVVDDFKDRLMTDAEAGKSTDRDVALLRPNLPAASGDAPAMRRLSTLLDEAARLVAAIVRGRAGRWSGLERLHARLEDERQTIRQRLPLAACA